MKHLDHLLAGVLLALAQIDESTGATEDAMLIL